MGHAVISVQVALLYYSRELITSTGPTLNITVRSAVGRAVISVQVALLYYSRESITSTGPTSTGPIPPLIPLILIPVRGKLRKNTNTNMLHLLDPGNFKKHIERTYDAVTAAKTSATVFFRTPVRASAVGRS